MIKVSGYSDDNVDIECSGYWDNEYDCYEHDLILCFSDGTVIRMTYEGFWHAVVEKSGKAPIKITKLIANDDYYSDLVEIDGVSLINVRKEKAKK